MSLPTNSAVIYMAYKVLYENDDISLNALNDVFVDSGLDVPAPINFYYVSIDHKRLFNDRIYASYLMDNLLSHRRCIKLISEREYGLFREIFITDADTICSNKEHDLCYHLYINLMDFYNDEILFLLYINNWFSNKMNELNVRELYIFRDEHWWPNNV